jgi:hypothetical protein
MHFKYLCFILGLTLSVCSLAIAWMLRKMVRLLRNHPIAMVHYPSNSNMRKYADMIQAREPLINNVIGFMDSVSFPMECNNKHDEQKVYYCGYGCNTIINNVFAYGPNGKGIFCSNQLSWQHGFYIN